MAETVSVVMPFYQDDRWFPTALASVLAQQRLPNEVIVVDDASPAGSATTLAQLPAGVRVIHLTKNGGPGRARQVGTEAACGTLISYLDSDDCWPTEFLVSCLDCMSRDINCQAVYTAIAKLMPNGSVKPYPEKPALLGAAEAIIRFHAYPATAMVFRREAVLTIGGWDTRRHSVEDWDLVVRFLDRFGPIALVEGPLPMYRVGHDTGRRNTASWARLRSWYHTAWLRRELIERHYGPGAHRLRFAQAIRDRSERTGGVTGGLMKMFGLLFGTPLDVQVASGDRPARITRQQPT